MPFRRYRDAAPLPGVSKTRKTALAVRKSVLSRAGVFTLAALCAAFVLYAAASDKHARHVAERLYADFNIFADTLLKDAYVEGARHIDNAALEKIMRPHIGKPLITAPIADIKKQVEKLAWSDVVVVERAYPNAMMIRIKEHTPAAVWQQDGRFHVINNRGEIIAQTESYDQYGKLILVSGNGAAEQIKSLLTMLKEHPNTGGRVASASFVGKRRWDIYLRDGVLIRLPEDDPAKRMARVEDMIIKGYLESRPVKSIDMKEGKRIYIEMRSDAGLYLTDGKETL